MQHILQLHMEGLKNQSYHLSDPHNCTQSDFAKFIRMFNECVLCGVYTVA